MLDDGVWMPFLLSRVDRAVVLDHPAFCYQAAAIIRARFDLEEEEDELGGKYGLIGADLETVARGFSALKVLGSFAEAFAKKLGESLAESTVRVLRRVRLTELPKCLMIDGPPGARALVLVLPEDFPDEARVAVLDLDLAEAPDGTVLHWNPEAKVWEPRS